MSVITADGTEVRTRYDSTGAIVSQKTITPFDKLLMQQTDVLNDVTALVNAIKSGQPLPISASGLKLINDVVNPTGQTYPNLGAANAVFQGALSLYNLDQAFQNGDDLAKVQATLGAIAQVNIAYQAMAGLSGTAVAAGSQVISETVGEAIPYVNIVSSLAHGDYTGAAVGVASAMGVPMVGWVYAAYTLVKALTDTPPEAWASAQFKFGDGTQLSLDMVGDAFGPDKVRFLMEGDAAQNFPGMLGYLNQQIASLEAANPSADYGIVAQRLPRVTWREARQGDPGYALVDIDPLTGEEKLAFLRYNDNFTPYNADPTVAEQRLTVFERMLNSAVARGAIAPLWEVQTAKLQQDQGSPDAGLTEEERAARAGHLAALTPTAGNPAERAGSFRPVALDLDGDGQISTLSIDQAGRTFDWDDTGYQQRTGWVGNQEGVLFVDRMACEICFDINSETEMTSVVRFARQMGYRVVGENFVKETNHV